MEVVRENLLFYMHSLISLSEIYGERDDSTLQFPVVLRSMSYDYHSIRIFFWSRNKKKEKRKITKNKISLLSIEDLGSSSKGSKHLCDHLSFRSCVMDRYAARRWIYCGADSRVYPMGTCQSMRGLTIIHVGCVCVSL